jgi:hypothetical protein
MKRPNDAAQAIIDGIAPRAVGHKLGPPEVRAELNERRFSLCLMASKLSAYNAHSYRFLYRNPKLTR